MNISVEVYYKHITEKKLDFPESQDQQKGIFKAHLIWGSHPCHKSMPASEGLSTVIPTFCFTITSTKTFMSMTDTDRCTQGQALL